MNPRASILGFGVAVFSTSWALAEEDLDASEADSEEVVSDPEDARSPDADRDFSHGAQFGLRLGAVWGYRMVFRYPDSPFCREPDTSEPIEDQQQFCGHSGPWALDAALSYAPLDSIEPFVWGRFGLQGEAQTNTQEVLIVGAGARIYTMSDSAFKVFVEPAVGLELEGGAGDGLYDPPGDGWNPPDAGDYDPEWKRDLVFHVAAGPQWDFAQQFGAYFSAGLTVGVLRYIHASMELQLGVQLRLP